MTPVVNLVWAPVFVNELAHTEKSRASPAAGSKWWIAWICSALVSGWATWTSAATGPQSVADNTVTEILAYLVGLTALLLLWRVVNGFTNRPVQQNSPTHRWVVVAEQAPSDTVAEQAPSGTAAEQQPELHRCRRGTRRRSTGDGWADPTRVGIGKCRWRAILGPEPAA